MSSNRGAVDSAKTEKAGCGIRFNPEQLGDDTGFDFSEASEQLSHVSDDIDAMSASDDAVSRNAPLHDKPSRNTQKTGD